MNMLMCHLSLMALHDFVEPAAVNQSCSSPHSTECIVLRRGPRPKLRLFTSGRWRCCISVVAFWGILGACTNFHFTSPAFYVVLRRGPRPKLRLLLMLVLIDRARRDDSNGGRIVNIHYFYPNGGNPGCRLDFQTADGFVALFLTEKILKFGSKEAQYTTNR